MIDIIKQTPYEYSAQSRDYQVLARLYTALFNLTKMYIDDLNVWNSNIDNKLTSLRSTTLNFNYKHAWDLDNLEAVVYCFKYLMRNKGATKVLEYCINILMKIENFSGEYIEDQVVFKNNEVTIYVPEDLLTIGIIEDLVKYLLPSGIIYNLIKYKTFNGDNITTVLYYKDGELKRVQYPYYMNEQGEKVINKWLLLGLPGYITENGGSVTPEEWVKLTTEDKIWIGETVDNFIPNPDTPEGENGLYEAYLLAESSESSEVLYVSKDGASEPSDISLRIKHDVDEQENIYGHFINTTFVYTGDRFESSENNEENNDND